MNYTFKDYEDAVLELLAPLKGPDGPLKVLKGFAGEVVLSDAGLFLTLLNQYPGVLVEIPDADYTPGSMPFHTEEAKVAAYVCARSLRSQEETLGGEAGAYAVVQLVREKLLGKQLKGDLQPLYLTRIARLAAGAVETGQWVAVYRMEFKFVNPRIMEV